MRRPVFRPGAGCCPGSLADHQPVSRTDYWLTTERSGAIAFQPTVTVGADGLPVPGVWRVAIGGTEVAWFDLRSGAPFDQHGNVIAFVAEPRLAATDGCLERFEARFAQWNGVAYEPAEAAATSFFTFGQMQIGRQWGDSTAWDMVDNAHRLDFSWAANHERMTLPWHIGGPEDALQIGYVTVSTRVYGDSMYFRFQ